MFFVLLQLPIARPIFREAARRPHATWRADLCRKRLFAAPRWS
jgi:hypothetical protein